jgi:hypothetical protein
MSEPLPRQATQERHQRPVLGPGSVAGRGCRVPPWVQAGAAAPPPANSLVMVATSCQTDTGAHDPHMQHESVCITGT